MGLNPIRHVMMVGDMKMLLGAITTPQGDIK